MPHPEFVKLSVAVAIKGEKGGGGGGAKDDTTCSYYRRQINGFEKY